MDTMEETFHIHEYNKSLCPFRMYGCRDLFPEFEKALHEKICPLRNFLCPICSSWQGTAEAFRNHIVKNFWQCDSEYFPIALESGVEVLKSGEEVYVLLYLFDTKSGYLLISLKYVGPLNFAKRRYFRLHLKNKNNVEYRTGKQVEPALDWEINKTLAIKIDLNVLNLKAPVKREDGLQLQVQVYPRIPFFPQIVIKDLLKDMTCPVCKVLMDGPIIQSHIGHSMCHKCNEKILRMNKTRNFALEDLCSNMSKYAENLNEKFNDEKLLKGLECPVCLDYMRPPVKVCLAGHSICKYCRPKLNECPMCRKPFTTVRNLSLESISNKIHYKCMNANKGCEFSAVLADISNHEDSCLYN